MKSVISLFVLFVFIFSHFFTRYWVLLEHHGLIKAGNVFGILVTAAGLFNAWAGVATSTNSYFVIPITWLSRHHGSKKLVENYNQRGRQQTFFYHF